MGDDVMLYRSRSTRWVLMLAGFAVAYVLILGDPEKWWSAPSLQWLQRAPIPLPWWGFGFVAYALLLIASRTRPVAFALGGALFAVFTVSLLATINEPGPKNVVTIAGMVDLVAFHAYAVKTSLAATEAERQDR